MSRDRDFYMAKHTCAFLKQLFIIDSEKTFKDSSHACIWVIIYNQHFYSLRDSLFCVLFSYELHTYLFLSNTSIHLHRFFVGLENSIEMRFNFSHHF